MEEGAIVERSTDGLPDATCMLTVYLQTKLFARAPRYVRAPSLGTQPANMQACCAGQRPAALVKKESWLDFLSRPFVGKAEEPATATDSLEEPTLDSDQQAMDR